MEPETNPQDRKPEGQEQEHGTSPPPAVQLPIIGSEASEPEHNPSARGDKNTGDNNDKPEWKKSFPEWTVALCTIALVVVAIFQYVVTRGQLAAMNRALTQTDKIIEQTQNDARAWIGVGNISAPLLKQGEWINVRVPLNNVGRIPAAKITVQVGTVSGTGIPQPAAIIGKFSKGELGSLFPNAERYIEGSNEKAGTQEFIDGINSGKIFLWVIGEITYDTYKPHCTTHFFYRYRPGTEKWDAEQTYNDAN